MTYFNTPDVQYDDPSPSGVALPGGAYEYDFCPICHSDWIEDSSKCLICGEDVRQGHLFCETCKGDVKAEFNEIAARLKLTECEFEELITEIYGW